MRRLLLMILCLPAIAAAQTGVRFDQYNMTSSNSVPFGAQAPIFTLPSSKVTVCAYPDDGGQPCGNVIPIYSNPALTQPADNAITADVHGRFGFWLAPGTYTYSVVTQGGQFVGTYIFTLGGSGGSGCTPPGTNFALFSTGSGGCSGTVNATLNANGFLYINPAGGTGSLEVDATNNPSTGQDQTTLDGQSIIVRSSGGGFPGFGSNLDGITMKQSDINYTGGLQGLFAFDAQFSVNRAAKYGIGYNSEPAVGAVTVKEITQFQATDPTTVAGSHIQNRYDFHSTTDGNPTSLTTAEQFTFFSDVRSFSNPVASNFCDFYGRQTDGTSISPIITLRESIGCGANHASIFTGPLTATIYTETLTTPSSSSAACTAGQFTDDASFHYVCTATNTWKRVALSSF